MTANVILEILYGVGVIITCGAMMGGIRRALSRDEPFVAGVCCIGCFICAPLWPIPAAIYLIGRVALIGWKPTR